MSPVVRSVLRVQLTLFPSADRNTQNRIDLTRFQIGDP